MHREPSIHITENQLAYLLSEALGKDASNLAELIVDRARGLTLTHRSISVTNDKLKRDTEKVKVSTRSNTALFAELLVMHRRKAKHKNIKPIKAGTKEFLELKEITNLATEFCNEFDIARKEGYQEYITLNLTRMKGFFRLSNFKFKHSEIINDYEATKAIKEDPNQTQTQAAHSHYLKIISDNIGFAEGYEKIPIQYRNFVTLSSEAKRLGTSVETWIEAQFDGLSWATAIPTPNQMVGTMAMQRLQKYCYSKGIKMGAANIQKKSINFKALKKHRDD